MMSLIIYFFAAILYTIGGLLKSVNPLYWAIPVEFTNAIAYFVSYVYTFNDWVNIADGAQVLIYYLQFLTLWYSLKIIRWVWSLIPLIGSSNTQPVFNTIESNDRSTTTSSRKGVITTTVRKNSRVSKSEYGGKKTRFIGWKRR